MSIQINSLRAITSQSKLTNHDSPIKPFSHPIDEALAPLKTLFPAIYDDFREAVIIFSITTYGNYRITCLSYLFSWYFLSYFEFRKLQKIHDSFTWEMYSSLSDFLVILNNFLIDQNTKDRDQLRKLFVFHKSGIETLKSSIPTSNLKNIRKYQEDSEKYAINKLIQFLGLCEYFYQNPLFLEKNLIDKNFEIDRSQFVQTHRQIHAVLLFETNSEYLKHIFANYKINVKGTLVKGTQEQIAQALAYFQKIHENLITLSKSHETQELNCCNYTLIETFAKNSYESTDTKNADVESYHFQFMKSGFMELKLIFYNTSCRIYHEPELSSSRKELINFILHTIENLFKNNFWTLWPKTPSEKSCQATKLLIENLVIPMNKHWIVMEKLIDQEYITILKNLISEINNYKIITQRNRNYVTLLHSYINPVIFSICYTIHKNSEKFQEAILNSTNSELFFDKNDPDLKKLIDLHEYIQFYFVGLKELLTKLYPCPSIHESIKSIRIRKPPIYQTKKIQLTNAKPQEPSMPKPEQSEISKSAQNVTVTRVHETKKLLTTQKNISPLEPKFEKKLETIEKKVNKKINSHLDLRKFVRLLESRGCTFSRNGGRHLIYLSATGNIIPVPHHPTISPGVAHKIIKSLDAK